MIFLLLAQLTQNDFNIPKTQVTENSVNVAVQTALIVMGSIAVLVVTIAGLFYVLSLGNPQAISKAKNTILYALIGLVVSIFAYSIVRFVVGNL